MTDIVKNISEKTENVKLSVCKKDIKLTQKNKFAKELFAKEEMFGDYRLKIAV